jgi:uncharacterized protein YciI
MAVFAVTTAKGRSWEHTRGIREQQGWDQHATFSDELVNRGVIIIGGPIGGADEEIALLAVESADERELRSVFAEDPWVLNEVIRLKEVRPWTVWLDGR